MGSILTIDDNNFRHFINPTVDGERMRCESEGVLSGKLTAGYMGTFEDSPIPLIDPSEWDDRIAQIHKDGADLPTFADQMGLPIRNQRNSNYCWTFGVCRSAEYALLRSNVNLYISPFSVGSYVKRFRNVGGWGDEALDRMATHGFNTDAEWDADRGAGSISRQFDTAENREAAKKRKVVEFYKLATGSTGWNQVVSCVLSGYAVAAGFNWWRHLIAITDITERDHNALIDNSWGTNWGNGGRGLLSGRKKYPDGAVVVTGVTAI